MDRGGGMRVTGDGVPCTLCNGRGVRLYGSTATWRGGMGGAAMTWDQCDMCWGSGDMGRPWPSIRELEAKRSDWEADQCAKWLSRSAGCELRTFRSSLSAVVDVIEREGRRRKAPPGQDPFWYFRAAEAMASVLRRLLSDKEEG